MKSRITPRSLQIQRHGVESSFFEDAYHRLLMLSWPRFFIFYVLVYCLLNLIFTFLYMMFPGSVAHVPAGDFMANFSFSIQTFSTIGYGYYYPQSDAAHVLVALESISSLMSLALLTGMVFVKFSKPSARIAFSDRVLRIRYNGQDALCVRMGNIRANRVFEGRSRMTLLKDEITSEGERLRRLVDLKLVRDHTPLFALSWTLFHIIDESSPFWGMEFENIVALDWQIIVTFTGIDEDVAQTITAHTIYDSSQFVRARKFADMIQTEGPTRHIDFSKLHQIEL